MKEKIKISFKRELLAGFLTVAVLPLVVSCLFLIQMFQVKADRDYRKVNMEQVHIVNSAFLEFWKKIEDAENSLASSWMVQMAMAGKAEGRKSEVYHILYEKTSELRELARFDLYSRDGACLYSTGTGMYQKKLPVYWGILKVSGAHGDDLIVQKDHEDMSLMAARGIPGEDGVPIGFVVANLTEENLNQVFQGLLGSQDGLCILNEFYEPVYSAGTAAGGEIAQTLRAGRMEGKEALSSWKDSEVFVASLGDTGLTSVLLRPEIFTGGLTGSMYSVLFLMTAFSFLLCLFVASRLSSHLSQPILLLNRAMEKVKKGNLDTRVQMERADEFGQLAASFDAMTAQLDQYMKEQVAQQKKLNEVQIAMMQAQLNPHFLYNTLDTMKWVAKANHIPEIATLSAKLAKILRTSISSPQMITLKEEMELVDSYAEIQKIRFGGRFTFTSELPQELSGIFVPKLMIQPIVENAMIHGLADCDNGTIHVKVHQLETHGFLCIEVTDNGCGISDEVLKCLNSREREKLSGHIGFYNVDMVIRLHYGDGYGLQAERRQEGGTCVRILLPDGEQNREGLENNKETKKESGTGSKEAVEGVNRNV